jgi:NAD(P)-dependent dehydrogenase (short-subunit alcohol dehydrogenase family)
MADLAGKVAIVTGGASGLGRSISERLAADGATVVISDIQADLAAEVAAAIGGEYVVQDVTDEDGWPRAIGEVLERHDGIHLLVNNAGIFDPVENFDPERMSFGDWRRTFSVNLDAVFLGCRAAIPAIRDSGGGSIVNIASIAGSLATPYATAYGASKAAVRQLTKSVAQHCAQERNGVRCNSVHPGVVLTPQYRRRADQLGERRGVPAQLVLDEAASRAPLGELVEPEEVAAMVAFLCSEESKHTTGGMFVVDSGHLACDSMFTARG